MWKYSCCVIQLISRDPLHHSLSNITYARLASELSIMLYFALASHSRVILFYRATLPIVPGLAKRLPAELQKIKRINKHQWTVTNLGVDDQEENN